MNHAEYEAYVEGWGACLAGNPSADNPHCQKNGDGILRIRWFGGWFDRFFWEKYRDPLWRKRDRK